MAHATSPEHRDPPATGSRWLAVGLPLASIVVILGADLLEGPKTAFVGVLAVVPMLAAVFGSPRSTALVGLVTWVAALAFGLVASDGNAPAQVVRLVIIAITAAIAVLAAALRQSRERDLQAAERAAAEARQLAALAETDQLTSILNRRGIDQRALALPQDRGRTVVLIDVDHLKAVNDTYGHAAGDEYIKAVAKRLRGSVSSSDPVGRWGGDEFLVVLAVDLDAARPVLARMLEAVTRQPVATANGPLTVTVSIGAARWRPTSAFDDALRRADEALYTAKQQGRNQVVEAE